MLIYKATLTKFKINGHQACIFFEHNIVKLEMKKENLKIIFPLRNQTLIILNDWWVNEENKMRVTKTLKPSEKKSQKDNMKHTIISM